MEMGLWTCLWEITLTTSSEVGRPTHSLVGILNYVERGKLRVACIQGSLVADYEYDIGSCFKPHCLDFATMMAYTLGL